MYTAYSFFAEGGEETETWHTIPVEKDGISVGSCTFCFHGSSLSLQADCGPVPPKPDVRRLLLFSPEGTYPLGIPVPKGKALVFSLRSCPHDFPKCPQKALLVPLQEKVPAGAASPWRFAQDVSRYFNLPSAAPPFAGLLWAEAELLHVAVPLSRDRPFPCMAVFCFGRGENIDGKEFLTFLFPRKE